eukprot:UN26128
MHLNNDKVPGTYKAFCSLINRVKVNPPLNAPKVIPNDLIKGKNDEYKVPTLVEMGYEKIDRASPFLGGETEGLK